MLSPVEAAAGPRLGLGSGDDDQITLQQPRTDLVPLRDEGCWERIPGGVGRTIDAHSTLAARRIQSPTPPCLNVTSGAPIRAGAHLRKRLLECTTFEVWGFAS